MAQEFPPRRTLEDRRSKRHDGRESSAHERRMEILNRSPLHRACNRGRHASVAFFSSRDVCAERFVSLQERASRALFPRHARHLLPQVTGVLSGQFVPGGEVDFQLGSETANVNGVPGAAISGLPSRQFDKPSHEVATRDDQSLACLQRVLGRVLELVLPNSLLRFRPPGRGRKHGVALRWASRRSRRIRNGPTGCHGGGDYRCSDRCVADGSRHSFACLPESTLEYRIVAPGTCVCRRA
jgi:hypothetical protein